MGEGEGTRNTYCRPSLPHFSMGVSGSTSFFRLSPEGVRSPLAEMDLQQGSLIGLGGDQDATAVKDEEGLAGLRQELSLYKVWGEREGRGVF